MVILGHQAKSPKLGFSKPCASLHPFKSFRDFSLWWLRTAFSICLCFGLFGFAPLFSWVSCFFFVFSGIQIPLLWLFLLLLNPSISSVTVLISFFVCQLLSYFLRANDRIRFWAAFFFAVSILCLTASLFALQSGVYACTSRFCPVPFFSCFLAST
jgi:hypothetical protein